MVSYLYFLQRQTSMKLRPYQQQQDFELCKGISLGAIIQMLMSPTGSGKTEVANCAPSFKPLLEQGTGKTQVVRINFIVTSAANVTLKIDPSVVLATRQYVDDRIIEVLPATRKAGTRDHFAGFADQSHCPRGTAWRDRWHGWYRNDNSSNQPAAH